MSAFEFVFSLWGLLLGLSFVAVLGGLARAIEARPQPGATLRIGWLTPALALFVLLDLISFWSAAWIVRDGISVTGNTLTGALLFASAYYLAAHLVFPREPNEIADLDDHYFRVRRIVLSVLFVLLAFQLAYFASIPALQPLFSMPRVMLPTALLAALMLAAMLVRGRRASAVLLVALNIRYLVLAFA